MKFEREREIERTYRLRLLRVVAALGGRRALLVVTLVGHDESIVLLVLRCRIGNDCQSWPSRKMMHAERN